MFHLQKAQLYQMTLSSFAQVKNSLAQWMTTTYMSAYQSNIQAC